MMFNEWNLDIFFYSLKFDESLLFVEDQFTKNKYHEKHGALIVMIPSERRYITLGKKVYLP